MISIDINAMIPVKKAATSNTAATGSAKKTTSKATGPTIASTAQKSSSASAHAEGSAPKRNTAPPLTPATFASFHTSSSSNSFIDFLRTLSRDDLIQRIHELLRIILGGNPSLFSPTIGTHGKNTTTAAGAANAHVPRVATSSTNMRSGAAADLAVLIQALQSDWAHNKVLDYHIPPVVFILKNLGIISKIEGILLPNGIGCLFGNGTAPGGMNPGGGMKRIVSAASLSSIKSDLSLDPYNNNDTGETDTITSSVYSDSKRGKIVSPEAREGSLLFLRAICQYVGSSAEPYIIPLLAAALEECSSSSNFVRDAAEDTVMALASLANAHAYPILICPILFEALQSPEWRTKAVALDALSLVASIDIPIKRSILSRQLPKIIPAVTGQVWDTKPQVTKAAAAALLACCLTNSNPDVLPAIPAVVNAIIKPAETVHAIEELKGTTFVATVDASTLSILCPVLSRGLKDKMAIHKRSCCIVIENMSRLVDTPEAVAPFGPLLVPDLKKVIENVQFDEIRDKALAALQALTKALGHADIDSAVAAMMKLESQRIEAEQARIDEERRLEAEKEEIMRRKEEEERRQWKEAMEAQRLLDKMALEAEEARKAEEAQRKELAKKSTKGETGKCQSCGLKRCKKTCMFYSG